MALPSRSPPTPRSGSWRSWKPGTAPTPASKTGSGTPKTPASAGSRPASSPSTRPGSRSSPLAADLTAWLRLLALPDDLSRRASRRRCATGSCTSPPASPAAADDDGYGYPRPGPGPNQIKAAFDAITAHPRTDLSTGHRPDRPPPETSENRTAAPRGTSVTPTIGATLDRQRQTLSADLVNDRG